MASAIMTQHLSNQPPKYPDTRPSRTPAKIESTTAITMAMIAVRVPQITRLNTSNPPTVVPQTCPAPGADWTGKS